MGGAWAQTVGRRLGAAELLDLVCGVRFAVVRYDGSWGQPRSATSLSVRILDILCSGSWSREIGDGSNLGGTGLEAIRTDR